MIIVFKVTLHNTLLDISPWSALVIWTADPSQDPYVGPAANQTFSQQGVLRYAFPILHASVSRLSSDANKNPSRTLVRRSPLEQLMAGLGALVKCPSAVKHAFLVMSNLMSKIIWQVISWNPVCFERDFLFIRLGVLASREWEAVDEIGKEVSKQAVSVWFKLRICCAIAFWLVSRCVTCWTVVCAMIFEGLVRLH